MGLDSPRTIDFETPLPLDLNTKRRENIGLFLESENEKSFRPNEEEICDLISKGELGLARFLIENWTLYNDDVGALELIIGFTDNSIPAHLYIAWCEDLLTLDPENILALTQLIRLQIETNQPNIAEITASKLISIDQHCISANNFLANRSLERGDWDSAIRFSEQVLSQTPNDSLALRNSAISAGRKNDWTLAISSWMSWFQSPDKLIDDYILASEYLIESKRFSMAAEIANEGLTISTRDEKLLECLVVAYSSLKEWVLCLDASKKLLQINRNNGIGIWNRKKSNFYLGTAIRNVPTTLPGNPKMWFQYLNRDASENISLRWHNLLN